MKPLHIPIHGLGDYVDRLGGTEGVYIGDFQATISQLPNRLPLHRHEYFEVFLLEGGGTHENDFVSYDIQTPTLIFVTPGQVHRWEGADALQGHSICFTQQFFDGDDPPPSTLLTYSFWYPSDTPPVLRLRDVEADGLRAVIAELQVEFFDQKQGYEKAMGALLRLLFIRAERLYLAQHGTGDSSRSSTLARDFRFALEQNFRTLQTVAAYAGLLNVSTDTLSQSISTGTGRMAGDIIRQRVALEARRLLGHTQMTISEIAYALGFQDPAYFSRFFRRLTSMSPGEFRDSLT